MTAAEVWTLGDEIRKARTSAHMDQLTLAEHIGVSRQLISKWERNIGEPTVSQWRKIAEVTRAEWLLKSSFVGRGLSDLPVPFAPREQMQLRLVTLSVPTERRLDAGEGRGVWLPRPDAKDARPRSALRTRSSLLTFHGVVSETCARALLTNVA